MKKFMAIYKDPEGKARAWGSAKTAAAAHGEAQRQLEKYREKKEAVGDIELARAIYKLEEVELSDE